MPGPLSTQNRKPGSIAPVLDRHLALYPLLQAEDLYKLVHQGVFGPGHIIKDPETARRAIAEELAGLRCCPPRSCAGNPPEGDISFLFSRRSTPGFPASDAGAFTRDSSEGKDIPSHSCSASGAAENCGREPRGTSPGVEPTEPLDPAGRLIRVNLAPLRDRPGAEEQLLAALLATGAVINGCGRLMADRMTETLAWCRENLPEQAGPLTSLFAESEPTGWPARHHSRVYVTAYRPAYRVVSAALWPDARNPSPPRPSGTSD